MTPGQRLRQVELPLALPVIIAGLRTAAVWTVGMATLSTPVGAPSLGNYIFGGLQTRNLDAVLVGCVAAAALALLLDALVRTVARGHAERRRALVLTGAAGLALLCAMALAPLLQGGPQREPPVRVGAKTFTEQYVLAEILADTVRKATGAPVEVMASLGSTVAFDALARGEIDLYVDYTGTIRATLMHRTGAGHGREEVLDEVRRWLEETHGIRLVAALGFENSYAFALPRGRAESLGVRRLSDLAAHARRLRAGSDYEFWGRAEWTAVREAYGIDFRERRSMDPSLLYAAAAAGEVDVITAFSSDGRIDAYGLVTLADDRRVIPPYDAVVLAGASLASRRPDVLAALARLEGAIDVERMRALNRAVDELGRSPADVAREFLERAS
jgi:osmoprotectant transport system permease protein